MSFRYKLVTWFLKTVTSALCKIDDAQVAKIPQKGPLILAVNHVNILDVPVVYTRLKPRPITAFVKKESWENPIERGLLSVWGGIPLDRGSADFSAFRKGIEMLGKGYLLAIAPEGTRSKAGSLLQAQPGVVLLALRSGAPILPMVYYGHENVWNNLGRLRRSSFKFVVGEPFVLDAGNHRVSSDMTRHMVDEVMYQMAQLLPESHRGRYANLSRASTHFLRFVGLPTA